MMKISPMSSLYIHMPWCVKKCPYCDFNSHAVRGDIPEKAYINELVDEYHYHLPWLQNYCIDTVFIGGGTPSLISPEGYQHLFSALRGLSSWQDDAEITLEANPGAVDSAHFEGYLSAGINRLSIGVQSFQPNLLEQLGRIHNTQDIKQAIQGAKVAGFKRINLDVMYALPGQTIDSALYDLQQAISQDTEHLSWYQLTLEPNTLFHKYPPKELPDTDSIIAIEQAGHALLKKHDFERYEVSAYARNHRYCRHNLNYWRYGDYLGIGAGAHSKLTQADGSICRHSNLKHPKTYLSANKNKVQSKQVVEQSDRAFEYLMNRLRLFSPVLNHEFVAATGLCYSNIEPTLKLLQAEGLVKIELNSFCLTKRGHQMLNSVLTYFL